MKHTRLILAVLGCILLSECALFGKKIKTTC